MCGLVGMMGRFVEQDKRAFRQLLIFDVLRGKDSTGVAYISNNEEITVVKTLGSPFNLFDDKEHFDNKQLLKNNTLKCVIGHNRAATMGEINVNNAHPFMHGNVVGAHNGTLRNLKVLNESDKFDTDSEAIMYNLSIEDSVKDVIKQLDGAYALTWWDGYNGTMNFIRNTQRPLFWTRRKDGDVIFWASEKWMLSVALSRCNITFEEIQEFDVDKHYSFNLENLSKIRTTQFQVEEKVTGHVYSYSRGNYGGNPFYEGSANYSGKPNSNKSIKSVEASDDLKKFEGQEVEFFTGDFKTGISGSQFLEAYPVNNVDVQIRFYAINKDDVKQMVNSNETFKVKIRQAVQLYRGSEKTEGYLLPDNRTIEKVERNNVVPFNVQNSNIENDYFIGFGGRYLSKDEWRRSTKNGCCYCSEQPDENEHEEIEWLNHTEYLCTKCKINPDAVMMASCMYGF